MECPADLRVRPAPEYQGHATPAAVDRVDQMIEFVVDLWVGHKKSRPVRPLKRRHLHVQRRLAAKPKTRQTQPAADLDTSMTFINPWVCARHWET